MGDRFGGYTNVASATPTISTTAYTSGDLIGGKIALSNAARYGDTLRPGSGVIQHVGIVDLASQDANLDIIFFSSDPAATTFTDNAAFAIADADIAKVIGVAQVTTYADFSNNSFGWAANCGIPFDLGASSTIYAAIVSRGTPAYATTTDLTLQVGILQD